MKTLKSMAVVLGLVVGGTVQAWGEWSSTDAMTGKSRNGIASSWTAPMDPMSFPYQGTKAVIGISCNGDGAYMRFTDTPNLTDDEPQSGGYSTSRLRVKFDGNQPKRWKFSQMWGSDMLHTRSGTVRHGLIAGNSVMVEIPWYGNGPVIFRFSLAGSADAYRKACAKRIAKDAAHKQRVAQEKRDRDARLQAERNARKANFGNLLTSRDALQRHIEKSGWECNGVDTVSPGHDYWFIRVNCRGGPYYLVRTESLSVIESASSRRVAN